MLKLIIGVAAGIILARLWSSGLGSLVLPFLIAYIAAKIFRPAALWLTKKCRISPSAGCAVFALLLCVSVVYFAAVLSSSLVSGIGELDEIGETVSELSDSALSFFDSLPFHLLGDADKVREIITSIAGKALSYIGEAAASLVSSAAKALPSSLLSVFIGAASFVYLMADMEGAGKGITELLPRSLVSDNSRENIKRVAAGASDAIFSYVKAYLGLGGAAFVLLYIGFLIIRVSSPFGKAFVIAVIDVLPIVGCGIILLPWGIYNLAVGTTARGVGLIVLYIVIWAAKQVLEPRLLGRMMGVNPFVMLAVVYIGWKVGGLSGVIILSTAVTVLKNLNEEEREKKNAPQSDLRSG